MILINKTKTFRLFTGVAGQQLSHSTAVHQGVGYTNGVSDGMNGREEETQSGECATALK